MRGREGSWGPWSGRHTGESGLHEAAGPWLSGWACPWAPQCPPVRGTRWHGDATATSLVPSAGVSGAWSPKGWAQLLWKGGKGTPGLGTQPGEPWPRARALAINYRGGWNGPWECHTRRARASGCAGTGLLSAARLLLLCLWNGCLWKRLASAQTRTFPQDGGKRGLPPNGNESSVLSGGSGCRQVSTRLHPVLPALRQLQSLSPRSREPSCAFRLPPQIPGRCGGRAERAQEAPCGRCQALGS